MRQALNHAAMPAVGFVEPWSGQPGTTVEAFISCIDPEAQLRIVSLDRDAEEVINWPLTRFRSKLEVRTYELGSWVELPETATPKSTSAWSVSLEFLLTKNDSDKCLFALGNIAVNVDAGGQLRVSASSEDSDLARVENETWHELRVEGSASGIRSTIFNRDGAEVGTTTISNAPVLIQGSICIGCNGDPERKTLNARIGRVAVASDDTKFSWHFPTSRPAANVPSINDPSALARLHNMPTFAVASPRFTGEVHDPRVDPTHFDAIHLHDDDFGGFDWAADVAVHIPAEARSGVFAIELSTSKGNEKLPFFVSASPARSRLAFLIPTSTYLAYADERLPPVRYPWHGDDRGHRFAVDNGFLSLYDVHSDLSGVGLTSSRRPRATLRDDYHYPLSNCPHNLPVDLQLLKFYARKGVDVDVITDWDLHNHGPASIAPYKALLTGSHPEYWSSSMMRALDAFLDSGGNLAYLGGNGFYWVVAYQDHVMEMRRVKSDIWSGRPGESHMSITGEPGGSWEDRGSRNPQSYLGVTFLIMNFGPAQPYRRLEASYGEEYAWLFAGVGDEPIGDSGSVLGGAAGYELDAVVRSEETPRNLVRLATADSFDESFQVRPDVWLADGDAERKTLRRADMTIYHHKGGGLVFCTGSVAWIGALPGHDSDNSVGHIMMNLARRFSS